MIYFTLAYVFFKIGLFSFGGGYVMIPLIQKEIELHGWLNLKEFADIVAISQMTPGPLAVNAATYVGFKTAGILGSFFATLGVSLPSFILTIMIARFIEQFKENQVYDSILKGIRPVSIGLMASAVIFFSEMSIFTSKLPFTFLKDYISGSLKAAYTTGISFGALVIFIVILISALKFKINPIYAVLLSAVLGIILL